MNLGKHHLSTFITLKIISEYVLSEDWKTAREMYPKYLIQMDIHTNIKPVLSHNFLVNLRKLCEEGKAESMERQDKNRWGKDCVKPTKLYRKKMQ